MYTLRRMKQRASAKEVTLVTISFHPQPFAYNYPFLMSPWKLKAWPRRSDKGKVSLSMNSETARYIVKIAPITKSMIVSQFTTFKLLYTFVLSPQYSSYCLQIVILWKTLLGFPSLSTEFNQFALKELSFVFGIISRFSIY